MGREGSIVVWYSVKLLGFQRSNSRDSLLRIDSPETNAIASPLVNVLRPGKTSASIPFLNA